MERVPVTHAGSLIRPAELLSFLSAIDEGTAFDEADYRAALGRAVADVVARQVEMGGADCGFAQGAFVHRVHEEIQWAKLASLVEGARIASRELWGVKADV